MAHKTLIGGAEYEVTGGKTYVGSTEYSISGGKTYVGSTEYTISFSSTIEFYLTWYDYSETHTLSAEEGMTWEEWVDSDYNTVGLWIAPETETGGYYVWWNECIVSGVYFTDEIVGDGAYWLEIYQ